MKTLTQFVDAELSRLDLCLHRQIFRLRARYQLSLDEFRGLYVSDSHVDSLIRDWQDEDAAANSTDLDKAVTSLRIRNWSDATEDSPWHTVANTFGLSTFEMETILLALAPQVDLKYETIYAYLNNDVSRKWPTLDLAQQLFGTDRADRLELRAALLPNSTLFGSGLLQPVPETPEKPSWLAQGFLLNHSVAEFLLGHDALDAPAHQFLKQICYAVDWTRIPLPARTRATLQNISGLICNSAVDSTMFFFTGPSHADKRPSAQAICRDLNLRFLHFDLEAAKDVRMPLRTMAQLIGLERSLRPSALFVANTDSLFDVDPNVAIQTWRLLSCVAKSRGPIFVAVHKSEQDVAATFHRQLDHREVGRSCLTVDFPKLDYLERRAAWERSLTKAGCRVLDCVAGNLAARFAFTPTEIEGTIRRAQHQLLLQGSRETSPDKLQSLNGVRLLSAARAQCGHELGGLAPKVQLSHTWSDLILAEATLRQVREAAAAIKNQSLVYQTWGFGERLAITRGLKILFAGASGTGKSMTASVIANDLSLDLYKIDLSLVVNKYIGETEKNLDRIFRAAHYSNAILFFDEADALFGKRSEVKDAHDRYANIEVAYLLQKMEEHEGAVILASNLGRNIDEAFTRRLHYIVEFPLPAEAQRYQIWRLMFPTNAPLSDDVDFTFLARQFPVSGGDIKNVVLAAAFLAAQNGQQINMAHLIDAMRQQIIKSGKVPTAADFKQYHGAGRDRTRELLSRK